MGSLSSRLTLTGFVVIGLVIFLATLLLCAGLGLAVTTGLFTAFVVEVAWMGCIYLDIKKAEAKTRAMWESRLAQPAPTQPPATLQNKPTPYDDIFEGRWGSESEAEEMLTNHRGSWDDLSNAQIAKLMGA